MYPSPPIHNEDLNTQNQKIMKKYLPLLGLAAALVGCKSEKTTPDSGWPAFELADQTYVDYFTGYLKGNTGAYVTSVSLTADQVAETQAVVWDSWGSAYSRTVKEQLPAPTPMPTYDKNNFPPQSGSWELQDDNPFYTGTMPFYYFSKGSKPAAGYPLFLFLHGSGNSSLDEWHAVYSWAGYFQDSPSLYFIPRSPKGAEGTRWKLKSRQLTWEQLLCQSYLQGETDPNRIYFFGISEGAYGSQSLAAFYADYLAGAGPLAGGENLKFAPPENYANIAFTMHTGEKDFSYSRDQLTLAVGEELDRLQAAHPGYYNHRVELMPGKEHGFYYNEAQTTEWLERQPARNPWPKYVYWEDFPLDEGYDGEASRRYRDGFYNLYVKERSNDDASSRSCYEMTITGNTVDLTVNIVTYAVAEDGPYNIPLKYAKTYTPATKGRVVIYLNDKLVDLTRPVTVRVNGVEKFNGPVSLDAANLVNSCAAFFDPERLFPASVEVTVQ